MVCLWVYSNTNNNEGTKREQKRGMLYMREYGFNTTLLHGSEDKNPFGATQVPIYQSSAFRHDSAEELEKIFANKTVG